MNSLVIAVLIALGTGDINAVPVPRPNNGGSDADFLELPVQFVENILGFQDPREDLLTFPGQIVQNALQGALTDILGYQLLRRITVTPASSDSSFTEESGDYSDSSSEVSNDSSDSSPSAFNYPLANSVQASSDSSVPFTEASGGSSVFSSEESNDSSEPSPDASSSSSTTLSTASNNSSSEAMGDSSTQNARAVVDNNKVSIHIPMHNMYINKATLPSDVSGNTTPGDASAETTTPVAPSGKTTTPVAASEETTTPVAAPGKTTRPVATSGDASTPVATPEEAARSGDISPETPPPGDLSEETPIQSMASYEFDLTMCHTIFPRLCPLLLRQAAA